MKKYAVKRNLILMRCRIVDALISSIRTGYVVSLIMSCSLITPHAEAACTFKKYTLPSISYLQLVRNDGRVVHLQRSAYKYNPTVHVWIQRNYRGQYYIPKNVYDIRVILENRLVLETWMGQVRQVFKQIPIAKACSNWRSSIVG
jgi:hypothetical protein